MLQTKRLPLRKWAASDADSLYEYAKDPAVGSIAGWPPHKSTEESLAVIQSVFNGAECYAICEKGSDKAIGAVELMLHGHSSHNVPVPLMNEIRTEHINVMTQEQWSRLWQSGGK